mmetsp:Transcript_28195/g.51027  ORF Transcript_28195/g.51027 Transcript_28195/m.51027 type:complete len:203 (+) Transcript_28195:22-630(+)
MASCATTKTKTRIESCLNQQCKERKNKGDNGIKMKRYCLTVHSSSPLCFSRKDPWWRNTSSNHCSHDKECILHTAACWPDETASLLRPGKRRWQKEEYMKSSLKRKEQAVAAKQAGDIPAAKRYLLQYKQLEAANATLFADKQEDEDQDNSLLDELYNDGTKPQGDSGFFEQLFGIESTAVELDDLEDLDPSMLRDMRWTQG